MRFPPPWRSPAPLFPDTYRKSVCLRERLTSRQGFWRIRGPRDGGTFPMAKAQFQRNQKVWVATVGAWAVIEKVVPIWARGFDEPVRITYDVGLGRDFQAQELRAADGAGDE